ncbi:response regulator [Vulgatibacter sp.]|uniref:response regulator n=1 Tax=Vulgatibacter sp. TaxID=1971226 RepID=UPI003568A90A
MLRILVVEDDPDIRDVLGELLVDEGYQVVAAGCGDEGLRRLQDEQFDVVVSDYSLPGRTGTAMLRAAAQCGRLAGPAILMTAHPKPVVDQGVRLLRKPLDLDEFLDEISAALGPPVWR